MVKNSVIGFMMRNLLLSMTILFSISGYTQDLIKTTDSLIQVIETEIPLTKISVGDTTPVYHTDKWSEQTVEYYLSNNILFKVIKRYNSYVSDQKTQIFDSAFNNPQYQSLDIFYYHNDSLIKAIRADYASKPVTINYYYFKSGEITELKSKGALVVKDCILSAELFLNIYKEGKIN